MKPAFVLLACALACLLSTELVSANYLGPELRQMILARHANRFGRAELGRRSLPFSRASTANCFDNDACRADTTFAAEIDLFLNNTAGRSWPMSKSQFQTFVCNLLSSRNPSDQGPHLLDDSDAVDMFVEFMGANYWLSELGSLPYPSNETLWWCFLNNASVYNVWPGFAATEPTYINSQTGAFNISNTFAGLGYASAPAVGGAGFYVSELQLLYSRPAIAVENGVRFVHSKASKKLISIDLNGAGTVKPRDWYTVTIELRFHEQGQFPRVTIGTIEEDINLEATMKWLALCFFCVDCTPGTTCS